MVERMKQERCVVPAAVAGLPASPARARRRLRFDLKKMLGLKRGVRAQRLRDGASPIRTRRRVERSMSEPLMLGDQEERPRSTEAHQTSTSHRTQLQMMYRDGDSQALSSESIDGSVATPEQTGLQNNSLNTTATEGIAFPPKQDMESEPNETNDYQDSDEVSPIATTHQCCDDQTEIAEPSSEDKLCAANDYGSDSRLLLVEDLSHGPDSEFRSLIDFAIDSYVDTVSTSPDQESGNSLPVGSGDAPLGQSGCQDLDPNPRLVHEDACEGEAAYQNAHVRHFARHGLGHSATFELRSDVGNLQTEIWGGNATQTYDNQYDARQDNDCSIVEDENLLFLGIQGTTISYQGVAESTQALVPWKRSEDDSIGEPSNDSHDLRIDHETPRSRADSSASEQLITELDEADGRLEAVAGIVQEALSLAESALSRPSGVHSVTSSSASQHTEPGFSDSGSDGFDLILATHEHSDCVSESSNNVSHSTDEELIMSGEQAQISTKHDKEWGESLSTYDSSVGKGLSRCLRTPLLSRLMLFSLAAISTLVCVRWFAIPFLNDADYDLSRMIMWKRSECSTINRHDTELVGGANGLTMFDVCEFVSDMHPPSERFAFMQSFTDLNSTQPALQSVSKSENIKRCELYIYGCACTLFIVALVQCG